MMAKRETKAPAGEGTDAGEGGAKIVIYSRIDPATVRALDEIRSGMRPEPSRAQMIDLAVAEYVERHGKRKGAK